MLLGFLTGSSEEKEAIPGIFVQALDNHSQFRRSILHSLLGPREQKIPHNHKRLPKAWHTVGTYFFTLQG